MAYLDEPGLKALWKKIKDWARVHHGQSLKKGTATEAGIPLDLMNGADSPAALGDTVIITKSDITALGIPGSNTTYTDATQTDHGLMSAADKKKLDGVEANANHYVHPSSPAGAKAFGLYKIATNTEGHVTLATEVINADISKLESDPTVPAWAKAATKPTYKSTEIDLGESMNLWETANTVEDAIIRLFNDKQDNIADLATIRSGASKGATAIQTETDPTVPAWAKEASKPLYTSDEIVSTYEDLPGSLTNAIGQLDMWNDDLNLNKADIDSPTFTGTPKAPTAAAGTNTTQVATTAFVQSAVAAASTGMAKYQGGMTPAKYTELTTYNAGWYWVVTEAGTIAGEACEIGDMVFCNTGSDALPADPPSGIKNKRFDIVQNNIDAIPLSVINALS